MSALSLSVPAPRSRSRVESRDTRPAARPHTRHASRLTPTPPLTPRPSTAPTESSLPLASGSLGAPARVRERGQVGAGQLGLQRIRVQLY
eukprot:5825412-Prymnesium_polylepis.2